MKAGWFERLKTVLREIFVNHFWGKVEGVFISSVIGLGFNVVEKYWFHYSTNDLRLAWDAWNKAGDILGTYGLIVVIPSALIYIVGHNRGKYSRYTSRKKRHR